MIATNRISWVLAASLALTLSAGRGFGQEPASPPAPVAGDHAEAMWEGEWQLVQVVSVDEVGFFKVRLLHAPVLTVVSLPADEVRPLMAMRTWSDSSGKFTIEAALVEVHEGQASLRRSDDQTIRIPLARLSAADQELLKLAAPEAAIPDGDNEPAEGWREYKPPEGSYQIEMPGKVTASVVDLTLPFGVARTYTAASDLGARLGMVTYVDLPEMPKGRTPLQFFEAYVVSNTKEMQKKHNSQVIHETRMTFKGRQGRQVEMREQREAAIYIHTTRFYLIDGDIYRLQWSQQQGLDAADRKRFFDSFDLVSKRSRK